MAYIGFNKLKEKLKESGAKNPGAVAAKIGMEKYGKKKFEKAAHEGKSLEHAKPLKK
jgi:hypothetical protein